MVQLIGIKSECNIEIRQRFSIIASKLEGKLKCLHEFLENVLILSTCNRTEIYMESKFSREDVVNIVFKGLDWDSRLIPYTFYAEDSEAVKHLIEVSCGFHSKILGEDQILGQIKNAYTAAVKAKTIKGGLERLFQNAIACGKEFKSICEMYKIPVSVPSIAVREALNKGCRKYMIIGFGEIGKLVLKYLESSNAEMVYIVVRDLNKIKNLCYDYKWVKFITFKERKNYYNKVDCIISCTSAPHTIISKEDIPWKKLLVFDLAVPRDVDTGVSDLPQIQLYDIDSISKMDERNKIMRKEKMLRYKYIVDDYINKFMEWQALDELSPEIQRIKKYGNEICNKRIQTFKNKRYTKDNEALVSTMINSTARVYVDRAIEVLKEEKLKGREDECLKMINRIFFPPSCDNDLKRDYNSDLQQNKEWRCK
ncbi:glutamyl-tRNA reductase [Clostridium sp. JNZ X4-2]